MQDGGIRPLDKGRRLVRFFFFDPLLVIFLVAGWLLIFASSSLALQRSPEQWLAVEYAAPVSADYRVDEAGAPRLAPIHPRIIQEVKLDALAEASPAVVAEAEPEEGLPVLMFRPTLTPTLVLTPTPTLGADEFMVSAGGPYTGAEGSPISLFAGLVSPAPGAASYSWDLDNDGLYGDAEGMWATVMFYDEGEYVVGVEASDPAGRVGRDSATISVSNVAPRIYGFRDQHATEGEELIFSALVDDPGHDVVLYAWDFGDGGGETGTLKAKHTYRDNGNYVVRLRAEDNDGGVSEAVFFAYVDNGAPRVDAGRDQVSNEGDEVTLHGSASDPGAFDRLRYAWDLDYDGVRFTPDAYGPTVSTTYPDGPAEVVAALRVEDEDGGRGLDTVRVLVRNVAPIIVSVTDDGPVGEGSPLTLVVNGTDAGNDGLTYAFDWDNDGVLEVAGQPSEVTHVWYDEGDYLVGVVVEDGDGGRGFGSRLVSTYNVTPTAVAGSPPAQFEGEAVTFDGSGSSDPGKYDVLTYEWDFGDGSPVASGTVVTHTYAENGRYDATLTVRDDSQAASTEEVAVSIVNANPVAMAGADQTVEEGSTFSLRGSASDPGMADVLSLAWDLDYDGVHFDQDVSGTSAVDWRYEDGPASYVVAFRVRDDDYPYSAADGGEVGETIDTLKVTVNNLPPTADAGGSYTGHEGQSLTLAGMGFDVAADVLAYDWDLDGDGDYDLSGPRVSAIWTEAGDYQVTLRITDGDGGAGLDTAQVRIGNSTPTADAGGPYRGDEGSPIRLTGYGTDPVGDVLTYTWNLDGDDIFEMTGQAITETWSDDGVYTVTLRVDDGRGGVATDDATVLVSNVPPTADAGPDRAVGPGAPVTFTGRATDPGADTVTYEWDFDYDGVVFDVEATDQTVSTRFARVGAVYVVGLRVTDDDGDIGLDTAQVEVMARTPTPTSTPTSTPTPTPTASRTPSATLTPTASGTPTPTRTPSATPTPTASSTPTATGMPTASSTPTPTGTPSVTGTPTASSTSTPTATPTASSTSTPTGPPSATPSPTGTPTARSTPTATGTPSATPSPTASSTPTATGTPP